MNNQLSGMLSFNNKDCPFEYNNGILSIDCNEGGEPIRFFDKKIDIKDDILIGKITNESKFVCFYIDKNRNQWSMNSNFICNFCLKIVVKSYAIMTNIIFPHHFQLVFENEKFAKWLQIYFRHTLDSKTIEKDDKEWRDDSYLDLATCKMESSFNFKGFQIQIKPTFRATKSVYKTTLTPGLLFDCNGDCDLLKITELCNDIYYFLQFVFHRKFVEFGDIKFKMKMMISKDISTWQDIGEIKMPLCNSVEMRNPEIDNLNDFGFIEWKNLYQHIPDLFKAIEENSLFIYNIPDTIAEREVFSLATVSQDAAAFEFHFSRNYPNIKSKKIQNPSFIKASKSLDKLLKNESDGDVRGFYSWAIETIFQVSFKEKIEYALIDLKTILKKYIMLLYKNDDEIVIKEISKDFRDVRNKVHGCSTTLLKQETINANYIVRIAIFCMQLKQLGFTDDDAIRAIDTVFEIRI